MHVMEAGPVARGRVVVDRLARQRVVRHHLARGVENRRAPAVDRAVRSLGIAAVEVDAEPAAQARAVRRDVEPGARGAWA